jgi:hypothetical protein
MKFLKRILGERLGNRNNRRYKIPSHESAKNVYFSFLVLLLFACHNTGPTNTVDPNSRYSSLPDLKVDKDDWGGNFTMNIAETHRFSNEKTIYTLLSKFEGKPVGFYLICKDPGGGSPFVEQGVTFKSMGDTSNNFLFALSQVYGVQRSNLYFADSIVATYVKLGDIAETKTPDNWIAAQTKLFFGDGSIELFMNIDQHNGIISFPEKDSSYRADIIGALSKAKK